MATKTTNKVITMEELLASSQKPLIAARNEEVTGQVMLISDREIILDLGMKSEGVLGKRDLSEEELKNLKVGDKLTAFVDSESESGQIILSKIRKMRQGPQGRQTHGFGARTINWEKFQTLQRNKSKIKVSILEINKGGLVAEYEGNRGFIPTSQIDSKLVGKGGLEELKGQVLEVTVIEVDPENNRLVFSQKSQLDESQFKKAVEKYPVDEVVKGVVANISDNGVAVSLNEGLEGFIPTTKLEGTAFTVGQAAAFIVEGIDNSRKRVNLSPMLTTTKGLIYK